MTRTLLIDIEEDLLLGMQRTPKEFAGEMRLAAAVKWYELGRISQEKASQIAGLGRFGVSPFQESAEDIQKAVHVDNLG